MEIREFASSINLPIISVEDTPGVYIKLEQQWCTYSLPDIANQKPGFSLAKALELAWSARKTTILACSGDKKPGFSIRVG
jgi:hypothetical protein